MIDFVLTRTSSADAERLFDHLTDHEAYRTITPLRSSVLLREGSPHRDGVGARRRLGLVGPPLIEEVVTFERPTRFAYRMLSGLPVKDHLGAVTLAALADGGTRIEYRVTATPSPALPGAGPVLGLVLKRAIAGLLDGVVRAAESETR